jgi:hypothetical protein
MGFGGVKDDKARDSPKEGYERTNHHPNSNSFEDWSHASRPLQRKLERDICMPVTWNQGSDNKGCDKNQKPDRQERLATRKAFTPCSKSPWVEIPDDQEDSSRPSLDGAWRHDDRSSYRCCQNAGNREAK